MDFDLIVIGSGPGGYVAAIRASQLGLNTAVVEREQVGGICLNWGCIPTKALLESAFTLQTIQNAKKFGIAVQNYEIDFPAIIKRSRTVASQVSKGVEYLFKKNHITLIKGHGKIIDKHTVEVQQDSSSSKITAKFILIATGARSKQLPSLLINGNQILGYRQMLSLDKPPESLAIIGSGATGVELGVFYSLMGSKVHIIEMLPRILPNSDFEISAELEKILKRYKIKTYTSTMVTQAILNPSSVTLIMESEQTKTTLEVEKAFLAIGISPNIENIGLNEVGIETEKQRIKVDKFYRTNISNIYAVGDVINTPAMAHVASAEGITAVEHMAGLNPKPIDYNSIPSAIFIEPQIASVGLTEQKAKELGLNYRIGKFPYSALGKATATAKRDGFVKLIVDNKSNKLLGAHIIGKNATDLISELILAKRTNITNEQIIKTIHPHPTYSEAVMEAAAAANNEAIHI